MSLEPRARMGKHALLAAVCTLCAWAAPAIHTSSAGAAEQAEFPLQRLAVDSWVYDDLEKLLLLRLIEPISLDTRPLARADIALLLSRSLKSNAALVANPVASRLLREFAWELKQLGLPSPHEDTKAVMVFGTDDGFMRNRLFGLGRLEAAPEVPSLFGERSRVGFELSAFLPPRLYIYEDLFATEVKDSKSVGDALIAHTDLLLMTDRLYGTLRTKHLDLTAGRDKVRWGPGRSGTLLLSDSAPPFFLLSYRGRLGNSVVGEAFHGTLNAFEGRYVAGHRLELTLGRALTIGLAESVRYDSPGMEPLYLIGIVPYALVEKLLYRDSTPQGVAGDNQRNNIMQAIDASWRPAGGTELYGEFLADDVATESSDMPSRIGYQLGAKRLWTTRAGLLLLQSEYTRVWNYTYSVYYDRDFVHRGRPTGYAGGPDSENFTVWLSVDTDIDWSFELETGVSRAGEGTVGRPWCPDDRNSENCAAYGAVSASELSGTVEERGTITVRAAWRPRDNVMASLGVGMVTVKSERHVNGRDRTYPVLEAGLHARW